MLNPAKLHTPLYFQMKSSSSTDFYTDGFVHFTSELPPQSSLCQYINTSTNTCSGKAALAFETSSV